MAPKTILIVEDEQIPALDLRETLLTLGYDVAGIAPTGEKAIAMVDEKVPDLILMDINLSGGISGIAAAETILSRHSVPIIYATAYADPELVERAKKTRPYGYVVKPYDERAIRTEIEIALYKFGLDQNFRKEHETLAQWVQERTDELARANDALRKSEAALRALSAELQAIIDNAPGMIWYKDTKNNFLRVNPAGARAFGLPVDRVVGKNARELFPDLADHYYQDDLEVIRSKRPRLGITERMTTARGETLWVQSDKVPILDEKGDVAGVLVFVVDITERKIAQDALALANKKLGLMASITRHDIVNQLVALNAYIELCRERTTDPAVVSHLQTMAKVSASIERHITFTRDYQTLGEQAPEWQDAGACVIRATAGLPMRNIRVATELHDVKILADPLFEKIFYNLIDNALRYGGEKMTTIRIRSEETQEGLTIFVEDDGAGVAPEDRPHLFTKGFGKNTGLGLFLSREILAITGMDIRETGTSGEGARFEIMVPKGAYRIRR